MGDVGVVVVTLNALPYIEHCLESLRDYETVVVDNGSTDGTPEFVQERFPNVKLVRSENRGLAAGWNRGMSELNSPRYFLILNADAWMVGDAVDRLVTFADARPDAAIIGPKLLNTDGSLQRSVRGFPTPWRLATEYLFLRRLAPGFRPFGASAGVGVDHREVFDAEWVTGAAMLVRSEAIAQVGALDEDYFLFGEEVDWCYRFKSAGWNIVYYPEAHVTHVGEASHGGRMVRELARSNLRFMAKHHGKRAAERSRRVMLIGVGVRALFRRGWRRRAYKEAARWLGSGSAMELLARLREVDGSNGALPSGHLAHVSESRARRDSH